MNRTAQSSRLGGVFRLKTKKVAPLDELALNEDQVVLPEQLLRAVIVDGRIRKLQSDTTGRILDVVLRRQAPEPVKNVIPADADPNDLYIFRVTEPAQNGELPRQHFFARLRGSSNAPRFFVNGTH